MGSRASIVKRLELLQSAVELEDFDVVTLQISKLQQEGSQELLPLLALLEKPQINSDQIDKWIEDYIFSPKGVSLTPHQQEVFNALCLEFDALLKDACVDLSSHKNFVSLSGFAGVGKTFLTSKLIEYFVKKHDYKVLLTTPTHKSLSVAKYMLDANNLKVPTTTLHSYLDIKLFTDFLKGTKAFIRDKIDTQLDYEKDLDILIVDESSMISSELMVFIEENLVQSKLKTVLFIGDPYQLPPVDEGQNGVVVLPKQHKLIEVVRQAKESYIKKIAIELKECIEHKAYKPIHEIFDQQRFPELELFYEESDMYRHFCGLPQWFEKKQMILSYGNDSVDQFNRTVRERYWAHFDVFPDEAIIDGEIVVFNETYKKSFKNSEIVVVAKAFKKQNKSIMLKMDFDSAILEPLNYFECCCTDGRKFNAIDPDHYKVFNYYLSSLAEDAKCEKDKFKIIPKWKKFFAIKEEYADLKYKFSSTIHKAQGSTLDVVYIDMGPIIQLAQTKDKELAYRLLYVAVTRAAKEIKIFY